MKLVKYDSFVNESGTTYIAECGSVNIDGRKTYNNPALLADFFGDSIGIRNCAEEHVYIACLNQRMKMIGCFEVSRGSVNSSMFPVREILQKSLLIGAVNIALSHNHPSGDVTPSAMDINATKRLKQACDICGIGFADHVVIGANNADYYSCFESGVMSFEQ